MPKGRAQPCTSSTKSQLTGLELVAAGGRGTETSKMAREQRVEAVLVG